MVLIFRYLHEMNGQCCPFKYHAMKMYEGVDIKAPCILKHGIEVEINGHLYATINLPPGKQPPHCALERGPALSWWQRGKSLSVLGIRLQSFSP
jgi:hypothetical protein